MTNAELLAKIRAEIERRTYGEQGFNSEEAEYGYRSCARDLLSFLDTLEEKSEIPTNLDEAAWRYVKNKYGIYDPQKVFENEEIAEDFKAGYNLCKEQMMKDGNVILAEEDFDAEKEKSMEWGYNLCKEQMLKEAVEGYVDKDHIVTVGPCYFYRSRNIELPPGLAVGDKVRIIICKKED